jgi:hypothetical protein
VIGNIDGFGGSVLGAKRQTRRLSLGVGLPVTILNTGGTTGGNLLQVPGWASRWADPTVCHRTHSLGWCQYAADALCPRPRLVRPGQSASATGQILDISHFEKV